MENYEVMFSLNKLASNMTNYANARLKPYGLTYTQLSVLLFLFAHQNEVINQKNICFELEISHATAVGIIARMHGRGLIKVTISEVDRRNTNIFISDHGIELVNQTKVIQDEIIAVFSDCLGKEKLSQFIEAIKKVNHIFKM